MCEREGGRERESINTIERGECVPVCICCVYVCVYEEDGNTSERPQFSKAWRKGEEEKKEGLRIWGIKGCEEGG